VGRNTELELTDGQKRLYERGVRWAGRNGVFWHAFDTIAGALGKSVRQVKDDMAILEAKGLMEHTRRRRRSNLYRFLWHPIFEVQSTALQEDDLEVQDSILEVQDGVILKVQPTALELCPSELRTLNPVKSDGEADYSPRIEKHDAQAAPGSRDDEPPKAEDRKADYPPAKTAGDGKSSPAGSDGPRPEPEAFQGEWTEDDLEAVSEFLSLHPPLDPEEWPGGRTSYSTPDWLSQALPDAGLGADCREVLTFLQGKISSGWNPPNWKAYLAVVRHEFERRQSREQGRIWSDSDLSRLRAAVKKYMEEDEPPPRFEHSCELRARGATAGEVLDLIERKFRNKKYRPGAMHGPRSWNWFLKVIGNEFSATERGHLPEASAVPRPEHQDDPGPLMRGIDALDSIVVSVLCRRCGDSVIQYADGSFRNCKCATRTSSPNRKQPGRFQAGNSNLDDGAAKGMR